MRVAYNEKKNIPSKKAKVFQLTGFQLKLIFKYSQPFVIIPVIVLLPVLMMHMRKSGDFFIMTTVVATFILGTVFNRQFSIAENEFVLLQMLPVSFREVLAAKNICSFLFAAVAIIAAVLLTGFVYDVKGGLIIDVLALALFLTLFFLSAGNFLSLRALKKDSAWISLFDNIIMVLVLLSALLVYSVLNMLENIYIKIAVYTVLGTGFYSLLFRQTTKFFYRDRKSILEKLCMR